MPTYEVSQPAPGETVAQPDGGPSRPTPDYVHEDPAAVLAALMAHAKVIVERAEERRSRVEEAFDRANGEVQVAKRRLDGLVGAMDAYGARSAPPPALTTASTYYPQEARR